MPQPIRILTCSGESQMLNAIAETLKTSQIACLLEIAPNQEAIFPPIGNLNARHYPDA